MDKENVIIYGNDSRIITISPHGVSQKQME